VPLSLPEDLFISNPQLIAAAAKLILPGLPADTHNHPFGSGYFPVSPCRVKSKKKTVSGHSVNKTCCIFFQTHSGLKTRHSDWFPS
jgi:hypothetical protein